jgi:hypothetical protein
VALPRIGLNEGSLLRRTLLHVATFVLGSVAFIGLMSFLLVSIAKGVVAPRAEAAEEGASAVASASLKPGAVAPLTRPGPGRAALKRPTVPTAPPSKDD